jgi:NhaA family Na+:H+ antiporter
MKEIPLGRLLRPFERFFKLQASSGILLLICTIVSLLLANSYWAETVRQFWHLNATLALGNFELSKPLIVWINDGLMAIFFFVVGLEIKRELTDGELSSLRQSILPVLSALGGMLAPAAIFLMLNRGGAGAHGWGIPMATDIAFAIGILALLGDRIPAGLKVFLTAVAIVDDLGSVLVIAFFYTEAISWAAIKIAVIFLVMLILANGAGVRRVYIYGLLGFGFWAAVLKSGIHPTIAGVLLAFTIPSKRRIDQKSFLERAREILQRFGSDKNMNNPEVTSDQQHALLEMEKTCEHLQAPSKKLEHALHPWVSFGIIPLFALANAGVAFGGGNALAALRTPVALGVVLGLVVGKQIGITLFAWIAVKMGWADLPAGTTIRHIYGVAWLGGVGFTMSLFIAGLAFHQESLLLQAKLGILAASAIAGFTGFLILTRRSR